MPLQPLTGADLGATVVSKLTRRLLPFLFLLYIVNYLDRINVGFAALQMQGNWDSATRCTGWEREYFLPGISFFRCQAI